MIHYGHLDSLYYQAVKEGRKVYELRVYDAERRKMHTGDTWVFSMRDGQAPPLTTMITEMARYNSFHDAVEATGYEQLLPQATNGAEATAIYNGFNNGHYEIDAQIHGVVRFRLCVVS